MTLLSVSCANGSRSKEKVQEAILNRLQTKSGLDLKTLDVNTTDVSFDKNMAFATVAFHPKGNATVADGMTMRYTLEFRDGKWTVVNVGDSHGNGMPGHPATSDTLPPGHPSVGGRAGSGAPPETNDPRGDKKSR